MIIPNHQMSNPMFNQTDSILL